ncbi:hypothetical protein M422DRAFT_152442 [Sphaerobolus stellatus SS14]|nr:hypothetical protein M422DRAFT_152442 [Sphaerobolus stellatus SS14]
MQSSLYMAFRAIIPKPEDQQALHIDVWPQVILPVVSTIFMAYLGQRPNTQIARILFFPIPFLSSLRLAFGINLDGPQYALYNMIKTFFLVAVAIKSIDLLVFFEDNQKVQPARTDIDGKDTTTTTRNSEYGNSIIPVAILEAFDSAFAIRGLKYKFGKDVYIAKDNRPMQRGPFLWATLRRFVQTFLTLDVLDSLWKLLPIFQDPYGRSTYLEHKSQPEKFLVAVSIHIFTGYVLREIFMTVYLACTIIGVLIFRNPPSTWPPIMDAPYRSQSLHRFWSQGWHQILRRVFMVTGGIPGELLGRRLGLRRGIGTLFGVFIVSSLYHELPFYTLGRGEFDWKMPAFFMMHGCFLFVERMWKKLTGKPVGGMVGWLWGAFVTLILGRNLSDSWHQRGFGGSLVIPPSISPARKFFFPLLYALLKKMCPEVVSRIADYISTIN